MAYIVAVSGYKNSGKTTLCRKLLAELQQLGIKTGYIKRTSDEILSKVSTDTGLISPVCDSSVLWGKDGLRFETALPDCVTPTLIASRYFPDAEVIVLEGGKELNLPKIWVRAGGDETTDYPGIFAVYDRNREYCEDGVFTEGDEPYLAKLISMSVRGTAYRSARIYIGDKQLPMKAFIADFIRGAILGMLSSLKDASNTELPVRVYIDEDGKNSALDKINTAQ